MERSRIARIALAILSSLLVMIALGTFWYLLGEKFGYSNNKVLIFVVTTVFSLTIGIGVYLQQTWALMTGSIFMMIIGAVIAVYSTMDFIRSFTTSQIGGSGSIFPGQVSYYFLLTLGIGLFASGFAFIRNRH